jgi:hypothetical protein
MWLSAALMEPEPLSPFRPGEQYVLLGRDVLNGYRITLDGSGALCTIELP